MSVHIHNNFCFSTLTLCILFKVHCIQGGLVFPSCEMDFAIKFQTEAGNQ